MRPQSPAERWVEQLRFGLLPSYACNLRCPHCYAPEQDGARAMPEADFCRLVDELAALAPRSVEVTGGEPLAWKGHRAALGRLRRLPCPVGLSTNGTLLDEEHLGLLRNSSFSVCLSLDGPEPLHDEIRGTGMFARMSAAARACVASQIPVDLSCTVTRRSLPELPSTVEAAIGLGARSMHVSPMQLLGGRSAGQRAEALDDEGCVELIALLAALRERVPAGFVLQTRHVGLRVEATKHPCSVFACWGEFCPSQKFWPSRLYVLPDGELLPQSPHIHPRYSLGNVLERGLVPLVTAYWGSDSHRRFQRLCRAIYQDRIYASERPLFFWDELAHDMSGLETDELADYRTVAHPYDHTAEIEQLRADGLLDGASFPMRVRE